MSDGLGLVIDDQHEATINSFAAVPVAFGAATDIKPRWVPPLVVESQGVTNSCAGHAIALAASHANAVATGEVLRFSRRFGYITSQMASNQFLGRDGGTSITSTLLAASRYGCCREIDCPFQERYDTKLSRVAYLEAEKHKHHGETAYDCRTLETAINWLTDCRCIVIGTAWTSGQDRCSGIEDERCGTSGQFRGYHARLLVGWDTHEGVLCPVVQNSHGQGWGNAGRAIITPDLWREWQRDANFFALGFNRIDEIEPQRKSWAGSTVGDSC